MIQSSIECEDSTFLDQIKSFHFDGVLKIKGKQKEFYLPLEYERSLKFSARYAKYFRKIYNEPEIPAILFISKSETIQKKVQKREEAFVKTSNRKVF